MIVYRVLNLFGIRKRCVKERKSDKNKRLHTKLKRIRGHRYWWKEVE
jgi:hypothetical protein